MTERPLIVRSHSFLGMAVAAALAAESGANMIGPPIRRRELQPWRYPRPRVHAENPTTKHAHKAQRAARKARRKGESRNG